MPWTPPVAIEQTFPVVHRSSFVDRAEPGVAEQQQAHEIMRASVGTPLAATIRRAMEPRFGASLSDVRVHSGPAVSRAADLLGARAMTMGQDVFMPAGAPDHPEAASMPLLAHELSHASAASADPARPSVQRSPFVLAQRASQEESNAEAVERAVSSEMASRFGDMTTGLGPQLARRATGVQSPAMPLSVPRIEMPPIVQREEAQASPPVQAIPDSAPGATPPPAADPAEIADKVYAMLERKLLVERERGGHRRP